MVETGATIWARSTLDSEIFASKPDKWFKIWFYIVSRVNHRDNGRFKRSQCHLTYNKIMSATGATKSELDHCIRWMKVSDMIATKRATRGFIVTVVNYNAYQNFDTYKSDIKATDRRFKSDLKATKKRHDKQECNNDNNDKNNSIPENLKTTDFLNAWEEWETFRTEIKKTITPSTAKRQLAMLSKHTPVQAIKIIENSITNGWQGLFPERIQNVDRHATQANYTKPAGHGTNPVSQQSGNSDDFIR